MSAAAAAAPAGAAARGRRRRRWPIVAGAALAVLIALELLGTAFGPGPQGPVSSSYATNDQGLAAWSELAARAGHPVVALREPLAGATLDPQSTVVVLDPDALLRADGRSLLTFVRAGGHLLIGGQEPDSALTALFPAPPQWTGTSDSRAAPTRAGAVALGGVATVRSAGAGAWTQTDGDRVWLADRHQAPVLMERPVGRGEVLLLADASPLQNAYLAQADNAQLALSLAGPPSRVLVFAESVHGFGTARGLAALPLGWKVALGGLALAGLLWIVARGRRLGPPDALAALAVPPRAAYVDSLALLLRRAGRPQELVATLRRSADRELATQPATRAAHSDASRRRALAQLGLRDAEIDALLDDDDAADAATLGAALAHLRSRR